MKIETLKELFKVGEQYKYPTLCEPFGFKPATGNTKKKHIATFEQYMKLEKNGTWFTVVEIYDEVQEREDGRKNNTFTYRYTQPKKVHVTRINDSHVEIDIKHKDKTYTALFDIEDYDIVMKHGWTVTENGYVVTTVGNILMHRMVTGIGVLREKCNENRIIVHHINHNSLDNRKCNLQIMTQDEHIKLHKKEGRIRKETNKQ